jgi:hypothetical protein
MPNSVEKCPMDEDLSDNVLKELECPVCTEYMVPPITLCESGHNICNRCRPKMKKCPTCRQSLLSARNFAVENLAKKIKYPCCNRKTGCEEAFPLDQITHHQTVCLHRFYDCPLTKAPGILCLWQGPRSEIKRHIDINHKHRVTEAVTTLAVYIKEFKPTYKYCRVIYTLGETFYQQFAVSEDNFYFVVQYVGPEEGASKYKYEFTLQSLCGNEKIQVSQVTRSVKVNIDDICRSGKCIKLHYDVVKNFLEDNDLKFEMCISEV